MSGECVMARSQNKHLSDIRQLVVGTVCESSEAFLNRCRGQTSRDKLLSLDEVKDVASLHFPGKTIWGAVEAVIPKTPIVTFSGWSG